MENRSARNRWKLAETRSPQDDGQSCHVRGGDWQRHHHRASFQRRRRFQVQPADHTLAVVHRAVRKLCRSHGRRPRQGAGRHSSQGRSETVAHRLLQDGSTEKVPSSKLRAGDIVLVSAGEFIPSTAKSSRALRRLTNRQSPANLPPSFARLAATVRPLPAARASSPIRSRSG